jgi:hypothetical protein
LEIAFTTEALRELCADKGQCISEFGEEAGLRLIQFLADIRAADSIYELPVNTPKVSKEQSTICVAVLSDGLQATCSANHIKNPITGDNQVDWRRVYRIKIIGLEKVGLRYE